MSYIQNYYQKLRNWSTSIAQEHMWKVDINFPDNIRSANQLLSEYEGRESGIRTHYAELMRNNNTPFGSFYARAVTLPIESSLIEHGGGNIYAMPLISKGRSPNGDLRITFLETMISSEPAFRAWVKMVGMYGLVARKSQNINLYGSAVVTLLGGEKNGSDTVTRRSLIFEKMVPYQVSGENYTQNTMGGVVTFDVSFKYERYRIAERD